MGSVLVIAMITSMFMGAFLMTTDVAEAQHTLLSEDFEGYVPPSNPFPPTGWTLVQGPCSPTNDITLSSTYAYGGTYSCRFSSMSSCGSGYDEYLITEQLTTTSGDQTVTFWYRRYSSGSETFRVGWSSTGTDVSTDFTWSSDITDASTSWKEYSKTDLPVGTKYVAVHYKSNYQYYLYVDNFTLPGSVTEGFEGTPASGFPPTNWYQEVVSGTDTDNEWDINGTSTHPSGISPHGGTYMAQYDSYYISSGNSARLMTYKVDFTLYQQCNLTFWMYHDSGYSGSDDRLVIQASNDNSTWTNLTTISRHIGGGIPSDWTVLTNSSSTYGDWVDYTGTHVHAGSYSAKGDPGTTTTTPPSDAWLITKRLSLSGSPGDLTFWYQSESDSYWVNFHVLVSTLADPTDYSGYTQVADLNASSTTWTQATINMNSYANNNVYIALRMYNSSSSYYYVFVDDFALDGWTEGFEPPYSVGWHKHTVDLSAYDLTDPYISFLGVGELGNSIYIDDVKVNAAILIPEFSTLLIPIVGMIALFAIFRKYKNKK